jgi:hypothetical protein
MVIDVITIFTGFFTESIAFSGFKRIRAGFYPTYPRMRNMVDLFDRFCDTTSIAPGRFDFKMS